MEKLLDSLPLDKVKDYYKQLDVQLAKYPLALEIERKTNVPKAYLVIGSAAIFVLLLINNVMGNFLVNLVGFVYPAYASFQAIETPQKDDDVQWLTYWVVFSFFNVLEFFSDILLFWIPFYFLIKIIFLIFLFAPQSKGALIIYRKFIRGFFIEATIQMEKIAKDLTSSAADKKK